VCHAGGPGGGRPRHAVSASAGEAIVGRVRPDGIRTRADPRREQRPSIGDCAARDSRAQGAPRFLGSAPPARCAAHGLDRANRDPFPGNYRRPARKCLTTAGGGATFQSSSLAAVRSPLHIARCGARSNRRSQTTVRSYFSRTPWLSVRATSRPRKPTSRIGLRFGPRPGADPPFNTRW